MELFYGILAAIALSIILGFFQSRKKKKTWSGTVTKIKWREILDENGHPHGSYYIIRYKTDSGKKGKINIQSDHYDKLFSGLKVGDRLNKEAGQYYPVIVK